MSKIQLRVGETYLSRDGGRVKIVQQVASDCGLYPFEGDNGEVYTASGHFLAGVRSPADLVTCMGLAEADEPEGSEAMSKIQLRVGETYLNRAGRRVEIIQNDPDDSIYQFLGDDGTWFTRDGLEYPGETNPADLVTCVGLAGGGEPEGDDLRSRLKSALAELRRLRERVQELEAERELLREDLDVLDGRAA